MSKAEQAIIDVAEMINTLRNLGFIVEDPDDPALPLRVASVVQSHDPLMPAKAATRCGRAVVASLREMHDA